MRRILTENARRKGRQKRGGGLKRVELDPAQLMIESPAEELLPIDDALECLVQEDPQAAQLVKLRYFSGLLTKSGPVRFAAKQKPHRPGITPALGLLAGWDVSSLYCGLAKGTKQVSSLVRGYSVPTSPLVC